jgi:transcription initiation factor TFIIH subunit 4
VTPEFLEHYTQSQWDAVLHFLVGTEAEAPPPPAVVHFLLQTQLMQADPEYVTSKSKSTTSSSATPDDTDDAPLVITQQGYDFMLSDTSQQVWQFVVQYLKSLQTHPTKARELRHEALLLLVCLTYSQVGQAYLLSSLSKDARIMLKDLSQFGLLYLQTIKVIGPPQTKHSIFFPTRMALQLLNSSSSSNNQDDNNSNNSSWALSSKALDAALAHPTPRDSSHLAIIVQTNFQVCAYTTSELHVSMLGLFCEVSSIRRLPNVVFMSLSRESVKGALALGIQTRQILRFLHQHAHPKLRVSSNSSNNNAFASVPANVVDQIWLWDQEQTRVVFQQVYQHECVLASQGELQAVVDYAKEHGALVYWNVDRQQVFLDYAQVERMQQFVRQWRAKVTSRPPGE